MSVVLRKKGSGPSKQQTNQMASHAAQRDRGVGDAALPEMWDRHGL